MGFFDKLKIADRLEALAGDAGNSLKSAVTPKAPFPLTISGLSGTASKKLDATATSVADRGETTARSKADKLEKATIGKVTGAVETRVNSEVAAVEKKVDDTVAAADRAVDHTIDAVGTKVDHGIASVNKSLDKALGRSKPGTKPAAEPAAEPEVATAAPAEAKDGVAAPLATGWTAAAPSTRARSNAVVGSGRTPASKADAEPEAAAVEEKAEAQAEVVPEAAPEVAPEAEAEVEDDVDVEGQAVAAARARKREADAEADEKDDDLGLAALFGEDNDDESEDDAKDIDEDDEAKAGEAGAGETAGDTAALDPEAEIEQIASEHEGADGLAAKIRALKEKLATIDNEERALLGGSLATGGSSSKNPWLAFFAANAKFKKKKAIRDFKNELEGKKEDDQEKKDADELKGAAKLETEEVSIKSGKLHRSEKSPEMKGAVVDTTGKKTGSKEGRQVFAVSTDNQLYMPYLHKDGDQDMLSDSRTLLDGEMRVKDGKITYLSNDASGEGESRPEFLDFLQTLRDAGLGNFDVFEASKMEEAKASDLLEEADKADEGAEVEPEPEQAKLLDVMAKSDEWKALIADRTEKLVLAVAEQEGWTVAGDAIVDATGAAVDIEAARTVVDKSRSKILAKEAAEAVAARKGARPSVDA